MRTLLPCTVLALVGTLCGPPLHAGPPVRVSEPAAFVEAFYTFHWSHDMELTEATVEARRRWLDPALYRLLLREVRRPGSPDQVPDLDGDPFTDSQEYPNAFEIRDVVREADRAMVDVLVRWQERGTVLRERGIRVELRWHGRRWRIANLRYESGPDLLSRLRREDPAA